MCYFYDSDDTNDTNFTYLSTFKHIIIKHKVTETPISFIHTLVCNFFLKKNKSFSIFLTILSVYWMCFPCQCITLTFYLEIMNYYLKCHMRKKFHEVYDCVLGFGVHRLFLFALLNFHLSI